MKKGSIITVLVAVVALSTSVFSQNARSNSQGSSAGEFKKVGAAGSEFLRIAIGARSNGMAGAFSAIADDPTCLYYNVAGLSDIRGYSGALSYSQWFGGYTHNHIVGVIPAGDNYKAAISVTSFTSGDIPLTTIEDENRLGNSFSITDFAVGASFSAMLTDQFSFGVTLKYIQNSISSYGASGLFADVGTLYRFGGYRAGFSISNLGPQMQYSGPAVKVSLVDQLNFQQSDATITTNSYNVPLSFKAGFAVDAMAEWFGMYETGPDFGATQKREHRLVVGADFETLSDVSEQFALGVEYVWNDLLALRGGYRLGHDQFGLSGGVGIRYVGGGFDGSLDYAIQPTKVLGLINRISLSLRLD